MKCKECKKKSKHCLCNKCRKKLEDKYKLKSYGSIVYNALANTIQRTLEQEK